MTNVNTIYATIQKIDQDVKNNLRSRGIVVPVRKKDGSIKIGKFYIKKTEQGFYSITDARNEIIVDRINLPQTAVVVANKLALGKWIDDDVLRDDTKYGYLLFDEQLHKKLFEKNINTANYDRAELMKIRLEIAKHKKDYYKSEINKGFEKLLRFR